MGEPMTLKKTYPAEMHQIQSHIENVQTYSQILGQALQTKSAEVDPVFLKALALGAYWHDIGKQFIPVSILNNTDPLTSEEIDLIQTHTLSGYEYLSEFNMGWTPRMSKIILDSVLYHHERYDGHGYPFQLAGEQIPLAARIIAVADAFESMTSKQVYRNTLSFEQAAQEIIDQSGRQFDPFVVDAFIATRRTFHRHIILAKCVA